MAQEFTREEFHALVWSKPITHLAREFGLSDVALHKICRKHTIPTPPAGWWAKKAAGKPVKIELLPERMGDLTDRITISGRELRNEPDLIAEARENARVALSAVAIAEAAPVHPIVARTIARLRKARPVGNGLVCTQGPNLIRAEVAPASIDRLEISLNRIAAALQASGADIRPGENAARIVIGEETISFSVSEVIRREKHVLTAKEQAKQDAWDRRQERRASNPWSYSYMPAPSFPEWDYHPSGRLSFELGHLYLRGASPRRTFRDGKTQKLEMMAGEIAVGVAVMAAAMGEDRRVREEEQRRYEEERRRRENAQRAQHIEDRRNAAMGEILEEIASLERLRDLLGSLRSEIHASEGRVATFLAHSERRLIEREAALSAEGLEQRFAESRLFGADDDHEFRRSGYW